MLDILSHCWNSTHKPKPFRKNGGTILNSLSTLFYKLDPDLYSLVRRYRAMDNSKVKSQKLKVKSNLRNWVSGCTNIHLLNLSTYSPITVNTISLIEKIGLDPI